MIRISSEDPAIRNIKLADLTSYLRISGWKRLEAVAHALVFESPKDKDGNALQLVLPADAGRLDFNRRVCEVLNSLSDIEQTSPHELLKKVRLHDRDVLAVRVTFPSATSGAIPLNKAVGFVEHFRSLVSDAACLEQDNRPYFLRSPLIGKEQAEKWRFGHTFAGSFGFTIESPVLETPISQPLLFAPLTNPPKPFERRVTERIVTGLSLTHKAILDGSHEALCDFKTGFNANLCDTMVDIIQASEEAETEYGVVWAPEYAPDFKYSDIKAIKIDGSAQRFLEKAANQMRAYESRSVAITGRVTMLKQDVSLLDAAYDMEGNVRVSGVDDTGNELSVSVSLEKESYMHACDAHRDRRRVLIKGVLDRPRKQWILMPPIEFKVI